MPLLNLLNKISNRLKQQQTTTELEIATLRTQDKDNSALLLDKTTMLASKQARQEQINERLQQLDAELSDIDQQLDTIVRSKREHIADIEVLNQQLKIERKQHSALEASRDEIELCAQQTTSTYQNTQEAVRQLQSQLQMLNSTEQLARSQMIRSQRIQDQALLRIGELKQSLQDGVEPLQTHEFAIGRIQNSCKIPMNML